KRPVTSIDCTTPGDVRFSVRSAGGASAPITNPVKVSCAVAERSVAGLTAASWNRIALSTTLSDLSFAAIGKVRSIRVGVGFDGAVVTTARPADGSETSLIPAAESRPSASLDAYAVALLTTTSPSDRPVGSNENSLMLHWLSDAQDRSPSLNERSLTSRWP